jgi:hypothetical protein
MLHNSAGRGKMNELEVMKNPVSIFTVGDVDEFLKKARDEAKAEVNDITTAKGRKAIASRAYSVSQMKTEIDKAGKELVSKWKNKSKIVDASRKKLRDGLDELRDEIRQPLTEWENEEKARVQSHVEGIENIKSHIKEGDTSSAEIALAIEVVEKIEIGDKWEEFAVEAATTKDSVLVSLRSSYIIAIDNEKRIEEDRIAEENRIEEERIKREKAIEERAKIEAEEKAKREAEEVEKKRKKELEMIKAENERKVKEEKDRAESAERQRREAEAEKVRIAERAKIEQERAVREERDRIKREESEKAEEEKRRAADLEHRKSINNKVLSSLVLLGIDDVTSKKIIGAIVKGEIPNVTLKY